MVTRKKYRFSISFRDLSNQSSYFQRRAYSNVHVTHSHSFFSSFLLQAEIEGPTGTPYEGKFFQLKLILSHDFPASPPRGFFMTKIYHPNVDMSTGAICVNTLKKDWTPETTFSHVLSVIRCLMIVPFPESSLNDEAGKLFMESYDEYAKRARLMAGVHGRPHSCCEEDVKSEENADAKKKSPYHRSSCAAEPRTKSLRDMNRSNNSGGQNKAIKVGTGAKKKAKSLKRL